MTRAANVSEMLVTGFRYAFLGRSLFPERNRPVPVKFLHDGGGCDAVYDDREKHHERRDGPGEFHSFEVGRVRSIRQVIE